jgi:hypothetical protein
MDSLKEHIQKNKSSLDTNTPSNKVWNAIEASVTNKSATIISFHTFKIAVASCCIALCGVAIWYVQLPKQGNIVAKKKIIDTAKIQQPVTSLKQETELAFNNATKNDGQPALRKISKSSVPQNNKPGLNSNEEDILHSLNTSFISIINFQREKINNTPLYTEGPAYFKDFSVHFKQMEKDENEIKKQIVSQGLRNELLNQLINIYQQKLNVLKSLQIEINKTNSRYLQNKPTVDSTKTTFINI